MGREGNDDGRGEREGDRTGDSAPSRQWRVLEREDPEEAAKEALDGAALAHLVGGPRGRETRAGLGALGVERDDGHRIERGVDHVIKVTPQ